MSHIGVSLCYLINVAVYHVIAKKQTTKKRCMATEYVAVLRFS